MHTAAHFGDGSSLPPRSPLTAHLSSLAALDTFPWRLAQACPDGICAAVLVGTGCKFALNCDGDFLHPKAG